MDPLTELLLSVAEILLPLHPDLQPKYDAAIARMKADLGGEPGNAIVDGSSGDTDPQAQQQAAGESADTQA